MKQQLAHYIYSNNVVPFNSLTFLLCVFFYIILNISHQFLLERGRECVCVACVCVACVCVLAGCWGEGGWDWHLCMCVVSI